MSEEPQPALPSSGDSVRSWPHWTDDAIPLALAALAFGRAVTFRFVDWDDMGLIVHNDLVHHPLLGGFRTLFLRAPFDLGYPQPLPVLIQHLALRIGNGAPWPFHLFNLLVHAANILLLRRLLATYALPRGAISFGTALFACHAIVAEPVSWCTGLKDLVAMFGVLLGLLVYRRNRESTEVARPLVLSLCALAIALGGKPSGVILPVMILADVAVARLPFAAGDGMVRTPPRWLRPYALLALAAIVAWTLNAYATQRSAGAVNQHAVLSLSQRLAVVAQLLALELRNLFLPVSLSPQYPERIPFPWMSSWGGAGLLAMVSLVGGTVLAFARKHALVVVGALWFAIALAPSSGIVLLNRGAADTYLYTTFAGIALVVASSSAPLFRRHQRLATLLGVATVSVYGLLGALQAGVWRSSRTLWASMVELYPEDQSAWYLYSRALREEGRIREALLALESSVAHGRYPPADGRVLIELGRGCQAIAEKPCATRWLGEAIRYFPVDPGTALRFLAAYADSPDDRYRQEVARAFSVATEALRAVAAAPEPTVAVRAFFDAYLADEPSPVRALRALSSDPQVGAMAVAMIDLHQSRVRK